jgi:hypothetical protein
MLGILHLFSRGSVEGPLASDLYHKLDLGVQDVDRLSWTAAGSHLMCPHVCLGLYCITRDKGLWVARQVTSFHQPEVWVRRWLLAELIGLMFLVE